MIDSKILNSRSNLKPGNIIIESKHSLVISTVDYDIVLYFDRFNELMEACEAGNLDIVKDICTVEKHINVKDENGWTPLIKATYFNQKEIVKFLISIGADVYAKNRNGTNLLMYAKETYKRFSDNYLFKLFINLGLSVKTMDFMDRNLLSYIEEESIELKELEE